jgi:hypothetical protein
MLGPHPEVGVEAGGREPGTEPVEPMRPGRPVRHRPALPFGGRRWRSEVNRPGRSVDPLAAH